MTRFFSALLFALLGILMGFTLGGGKVGALFPTSAILSIGSFVVGSWVFSFGYLQPFRMVMDAVRGPRKGGFAGFGAHVLLCECVSRATLFGAAIAFLLGFIKAFASLSGDVSVVGEYIGEAIAAPVLGVLFSTLLCKGLKHRFLSLQSEPCMAREPLTIKDALISLFFGIVGFAIAVALTVLYMAKITSYLEKILRQ